MKKAEFLAMMHQDIATEKDNKANYEKIIEVMEMAIPAAADIKVKGKTPQDAYKKMRNFAQKNQTNNCYLFGHKESIDFIANYLGVKSAKQSEIIDLEDLI